MNILQPQGTKPSRLRVIITMNNAPGGIERLKPTCPGIWDQVEFLLNPPPGTEGDFWIVAYNARPRDTMRVAKENTMLIVAEPREKKLYPQRYYRQFRHLLDSHPDSKHPGLRIDAPALCWHIGLQFPENEYLLGYDELIRMPYPKKANKVAAVCSDSRFSPGQIARLDFLEALKKKLPNAIEHYGRGFQPIADKLSAIYPARYHLVLENCQYPSYWTEKIADAYLGWAYPLHVGCPNLEEFFPAKSFVRIQTEDIESAAETIQSMLDRPHGQSEIDTLAEAREKVLHHWNVWAVWARHALQLWEDVPRKSTTIWSHKAFRPDVRGMLFKIKTWTRQRVA